MQTVSVQLELYEVYVLSSEHRYPGQTMINAGAPFRLASTVIIYHMQVIDMVPHSDAFAHPLLTQSPQGSDSRFTKSSAVRAGSTQPP